MASSDPNTLFGGNEDADWQDDSFYVDDEDDSFEYPEDNVNLMHFVNDGRDE